MITEQHRQRFQQTIERLLFDLESMRADQAAVYAIGHRIHLQFLHQARAAFETDRLIRLIRLLDRDTQAASFWYLHRCEPALLMSALLESGLDIGVVENLSVRVKRVRDKVFVHADKDAVSNPDAI